jgi:hypothetical protein
MTASPEPLSVGDSYKLPYTLTADDPAFTNWAGVVVTTTVTKPDGTPDTPTTTPGTPVGPVRVYTAVGSCSQPGIWSYKFAATGALTEVSEGQFEVTPAGTTPSALYCTVGEVRGQLGDDGGNLDGTLLQRAVNATSEAIDTYCSGGVTDAPRRFWRDLAPTIRVFRTDDPWRAWVADISTATGLLVKTDEDGDGVFETTWTITTDFQLEPLNADLEGSAWWEIVAVGTRQFPVFPQRAGVQVTARFGWPAIPYGVNQAAILKAVKLFRRKDSPDGWRGFTDFGPVRISRYEDPDVAAMLEPFMKTRSRTLNYTPQRSSLFHGGR